jgi:hypothetical protein
MSRILEHTSIYSKGCPLLILLGDRLRVNMRQTTIRRFV